MRPPRPVTRRARRPHLWDRRRVFAPPVAPPPAVTVLSVRFLDDLSLIWAFSAAVSTDGSPSPQLQVNDRIHGWTAPVALEAYDATALLVYYPSSAFDADSLYRVIAAPEHIAFADDAALALPQTGTLEPF